VLLDHGATLDIGGESSLVQAVNLGSLEIVFGLLQKGATEKEAALDIAIRLGHRESALLLSVSTLPNSLTQFLVEMSRIIQNEIGGIENENLDGILRIHRGCVLCLELLNEAVVQAQSFLKSEREEVLSKRAPELSGKIRVLTQSMERRVAGARTAQFEAGEKLKTIEGFRTLARWREVSARWEKSLWEAIYRMGMFPPDVIRKCNECEQNLQAYEECLHALTVCRKRFEARIVSIQAVDHPVLRQLQVDITASRQNESGSPTQSGSDSDADSDSDSDTESSSESDAKSQLEPGSETETETETELESETKNDSDSDSDTSSSSS
jgi:hypothetical protein